MNTFSFQATGIGSLGHCNSKDAVSLVLEVFPEIPFWVQLPQRSFKENMYVQFSEGIPGIVIKEEERKIYIDTRKINEEDLANVYESYLKKDVEKFSITKEYAEGFYEYMEQMKGRDFLYLKGQITGPISFLLTITDELKRPIIYNEGIADSILKILSLKALWQIKKLKEVSDKVIIFIDEPYLVSLGSGFVNLDPRDVLKNLNEIIEEIKKEKVWVGIHCCGNTDWGLLSQTDTDIISFDAYNFGESLLIYSEAINEFLKRGGIIAWGIVPTDLEEINIEDLFKRLKEEIKLLENKGINKEILYRQSLVTPSCGLGSYTPERGENVLRITKEISLRIKEKLR